MTKYDKPKFYTNGDKEKLEYCPNCGIKESLILMHTVFKSAKIMKEIEYYCKCCQLKIINIINFNNKEPLEWNTEPTKMNSD